ncbi:MAG: succinate dehydrogenase assembly factor 4 [Alphaproteobacteria bacterium]
MAADGAVALDAATRSIYPSGMTDDTTAPADPKGGGDAKEPAARPKPPAGPPQKPGEIGGGDGPEPTRYGDWEVGGRCTDF